MPKLSYNGHDIDVRNGIWERVYYDRRRVVSGWSMFGKTYTFTVQEGKEVANYSVRISSGLTGARVTVKRNGVVIFSDNPKNPIQIVTGMANGVSVSIPIPGPTKPKSKAGWGSGGLLVLVGLYASQTVPDKEKHNEALREEIRNTIKKMPANIQQQLLAQLGLQAEHDFDRALKEAGTSYLDLLGLTYENYIVWSQVVNPRADNPKKNVVSWGIFNHAHFNQGKLEEVILSLRK